MNNLSLNLYKNATVSSIITTIITVNEYFCSTAHLQWSYLRS